jgi:hypothetical protein
VAIQSEDDIAKKVSNIRQIVQPYIHARAEWRVFVVGGVSIGAMRKTAKNQGRDMRILTSGYDVTNETDPALTDQLFSIAEQVASLFHYELAGVDIVMNDSNGQLYVYELNGTPGWENGFDRVTGESVPLQVLGWMKERYEGSFDRNSSKKTGKHIKRYLLNRTQRLPIRHRSMIDVMMAEKNAIKSDKWAAINNQILMQSIHKNKDEERKIISELRKSKEQLRSLDVNEIMQADMPLHGKVDLLVDKIREIDTFSTSKKQTKEALKATSNTILQNYFSCTLEAKLKFSYFAQKNQFSTPITAISIGEAMSKISWAGNFIVGNDDSSMLSTRHTLRQNILASIYFVRLVQIT